MVNLFPLPNSVQYHSTGSLKRILAREGVSKVLVSFDSDELPLLPYRHDNKLIFPKGKFKGWYTHIELRTAIKHGYTILKVYETISYSLMFSPYSKYINILYDKRLKAKKKGDSSQLIYKLLMNSLYGKFGERKHQKTVHFDLLNMNKEETLKFQDNKIDTTITINEDGKGYYTIDEECTSNHVFPILPVYVTAYARIKLWEVARLVDPYYMDTDSIITKSELKHGKGLGELDLEHNIDKGIFIKPKMYFFLDGKEEIVKLKGVPHVNKKQFFNIIKGKSVKYKKFAKLKESIRRNLKVNSIQEVEKYIDLEDTKRSWNLKFGLDLENSRSKCLENEKEILQNESIIKSIRSY